jgi:parallel beta-helix repeat protein
MRNWYGIYMWYSDGINISHNYVSSNVYGIDINHSARNNVIYNTIYSHDVFDTGKGINLWHSKENNIIGNDASYNWYGIFLKSSNDNNISDNTLFSDHHYGIYLASSDNNNIIQNNITTNDWFNIYLSSSSNNYIYHNNFYDFFWLQAQDGGGNNKWDNGYPSGGNYWSDYGGVDYKRGPNQNVPGSDGIGDTPYDESNFQDHYPLMGPYKPLENFTILKEGWNQISIPLIQTEHNLTRILGFIDGWYDAVQWYDPIDPNDSWKHHKVGKLYGNDLNELNETMGIWIHITQPGDTIFVYNGTEPTQNQNIRLASGWNMVGYPSLSNKNRTTALNNLTFDTHIDTIWTYNVTIQKWEKLGEYDLFEVGRGYYIHAKTDCIWEVPL